MSKPIYISKDENSIPVLDFHELRSKGIAYLEELSGQNWTDFNEHDPGVTILEQLCFALTELGYKTNFDLSDLLESQLTHPDSDSAFFTPAQILPTGPVSIIDFQKIAIDRIPGVQNIRVRSLNSSNQSIGIRGLYIVMVQPNLQLEQSAEELREEVFKLLRLYNNLAEDVEDIIVLEKQHVQLLADIELEQEADVEWVHANILVALDRFLNNPIPFYSLSEMLEEYQDINLVFEGPRLQNGFIREQDLKQSPEILYSSQFIQVIREVEGVAAVMSIEISGTEEESNCDPITNQKLKDTLFIKMGSMPALCDEMMDPFSGENYLKYFKKGVSISPFDKEVQSHLKDLQASSHHKHKQNFDQQNDIKWEFGEKRPIAHYDSIQHSFPKIYAVGDASIPQSLAYERKAQIFQLKSYLLFFEQILSNFLGQLERFNELFALNKELNQSYFGKFPMDIPSVRSLTLEGTKSMSDQEYELKMNDAVLDILGTIDDFDERRNQFLDHLLGRFGEDTQNFIFGKFNYYHSVESFKKWIRGNKIDFLKNIDWLTGNRARSFIEHKEYWGQKNYSVVESRIRKILGIDFPARKNCSFLSERIYFGAEVSSFEISPFYENSTKENTNRIDTELEGITSWTFENEEIENVQSVLEKSHLLGELWADCAENLEDLVEDISYFDEKYIQAIDIDEDFFQRGFWTNNLKFCVSENKDQVYILFRKRILGNLKQKEAPDFLQEMLKEGSEGDKMSKLLYRQDAENSFLLDFIRGANEDFIEQPVEAWKVIYTAKDADEARKVCASLSAYLKILNLSTEGLYLIDHLLLRPRNKTNTFGVHFKNLKETVSIYSTEQFTYEEMEKAIVQLAIEAREGKVHIRKNAEGRYESVLKFETKEIAHSTISFSDLAKAKQNAVEIVNYFSKFNYWDLRNDAKVSLYNQYYEGIEIDGGEYSFTATVVLPNWTGRFKDQEFQRQLERLIRFHIPAHICVQFKWMSFLAMSDFEQVYADWLEQMKETEGSVELNQLSLHLKEILTGSSRNKSDRKLKSILKQKLT